MPTAGDSLEELQPYLCCLFLVTLANFQATKVRLADWASTASRLHGSIVVRVRMRSCYCFVFSNRVETAMSRGNFGLLAGIGEIVTIQTGFFSSASPGRKALAGMISPTLVPDAAQATSQLSANFVWFSAASFAVPRPARRRVIVCD